MDRNCKYWCIAILSINIYNALNDFRYFFKTNIAKKHFEAKEPDIEKIFQPYFTSKESTGGSGLGLYMSRIIIEKNMDGKLTAINTDQGAKFCILV